MWFRKANNLYRGLDKSKQIRTSRDYHFRVTTRHQPPWKSIEQTKDSDYSCRIELHPFFRPTLNLVDFKWLFLKRLCRGTPKEVEIPPLRLDTKHFGASGGTSQEGAEARAPKFILWIVIAASFNHYSRVFSRIGESASLAFIFETWDGRAWDSLSSTTAGFQKSFY